MQRRGWTRMVVGAVVVTLLGAACGSDSDVAATGTETVGSDDGVLSVTIPEGAAEGVEVQVATIPDDAIPSSLRSAGSTVVGYELSPDGAEFSEPLTVTFRLDPTDLGFDLADGAVPFGLLLTENAAGDLESMAGATISRRDEMVVAQGQMSHFTPAYFQLSDELIIGLAPNHLDLNVGKSERVEVAYGLTVVGEVAPDSGITFEFRDVAWTAQTPFSAVGDGATEPVAATIGCSAATDGVVSDAFTVHLVPQPVGLAGAIAIVFDQLDALGVPNLGQSFDLAGEGTCRPEGEPAPDTTTGGSSSGESQPGEDPADDWTGSSGPTSYDSGVFNIVGLSFDGANGYFDLTFDEDSEGADRDGGWWHVEVTFIDEIDNRVAMIYRDTGGGPEWLLVDPLSDERPTDPVLEVVWLQANVLRFIIEGIDVTNIAGWEAFTLVRTGSGDTYEDPTARQPGG